MMERDDHIFDNKIREKLAAYSDPVPEDVWERISKKRSMASAISSRYKLIGGVSVLLIVALSVTISMNINSGKISTQNSVTSSEKSEIVKTINSTIIEQPKIEKQANNIQKNSSSDKIQNISQESSNIEVEKPVNPKTVQSLSANQTDHKALVLPVVAQNESIDYPASAENISNSGSVQTHKNQQFSNNNITTQFTSVSFIKQTSDNSTSNSVSVQQETLPMSEVVSAEVKNNQTVADSGLLKADTTVKAPEAAIPSPASNGKFHFKCIDLMLTGGMVLKSTDASDPASESYARLMNGITKTTYNIGIQAHYRYFLNEFWNVSTGLMFYQVKEELSGQLKPAHTSITQTQGTIISPFGQPRQVIFTDTTTIAAQTISQYNTYTYLRIPLLAGANFVVFRIPFNLYAGFGYFISIRQSGFYINPSSLVPIDFENTLNNPYKNAQGVNVQAGLNAGHKLGQRTNLLFGIDYSRYVIPITDNVWQYQQYYQTINLNLGITYMLN